ncbi:alpha/beta fold hydrolase [Halorubrum saccharovorum]|uniref:alpha/beta hydrolase n=1 Tax=Halorubrum saccharovorum TaxID=2248 RepID=UPI001F28184D
MAPGLGAERSFGYPAVAERFADAGYAAFLFDYRGFGESDGDSQLVDPEGQRADYAAAIDRVQRVDAVGRDLVLWGASLSAAHVLTLAAERRDPDAVIAAVPMLDGRGIARRRGAKYLARSGIAGAATCSATGSAADGPSRSSAAPRNSPRSRSRERSGSTSTWSTASRRGATRRPPGRCCGWRATARSSASAISGRRPCSWRGLTTPSSTATRWSPRPIGSRAAPSSPCPRTTSLPSARTSSPRLVTSSRSCGTRSSEATVPLAARDAVCF